MKHRINPLTLKKIRRFKSIKRGYYSFLVLIMLIVLAALAELWINNRALIVKYDGHLYFPTYGNIIPGKVFGFDYNYETNYRDLKVRFAEEGRGNWLLMPVIPYNAFENDLRTILDDEGNRFYAPHPPSFAYKHFLGTDRTGRDVAARLFYGFRVAISFSLILLAVNYSLGITIGSLMGFLGGRFDLFFQRLIEIWANVPFLYVVIIISSIMVPNFFMLIGILVFFGWMGMTWYMRTSTYKEKNREYVMAAQALGASKRRIIFRHILPNSVAIIVSMFPFTIAAGIASLTSLDYLGFGLPAPTPSWGELLSQGTQQLHAQWIVSSVIVAMVLILTMVTFIGEAVREAFDPKMHTTYE